MSPHILLKKKCCDLNLGEGLCTCTFFLFPHSELYLLNGFEFISIYFEWRYTENQQDIYDGENNEPRPIHVKTNWNPPVQPSVALETYLKEVSLQLAETGISKPKNNLPYNEIKVIKELKGNPEINIKLRQTKDRNISVLLNSSNDAYT